MDASDQVWAQQQGVFHEKSEKMTLEHSVLERMENMSIKIVCFLENGHFYKIWVGEHSFFTRNPKKGNQIDFLNL